MRIAQPRFFPVILATLLGLLAPVSAFAYEDIELRCGTEFANPADISRCLGEALTGLDRQLQQVEKTLEDTLVGVKGVLAQENVTMILPVDSLRQAEQSWRNYRGHNCRYYAIAYSPVSDPDKEAIVCKLRMTQKRMDELAGEEKFWREKFLER